MPKFEVRLRSQTDEQSRLVTLSAESEEEAKAVCVLREREFVDYTLQTDTNLSDDDRQRISDIAINDDGKVLAGANRRDRAKRHQHEQCTLYVVEGVQPVAINVDRLVAELAVLKQEPRAWKRVLEALEADGIPTAAVTASQYGVPVKNQWDGTSVIDFDTDTMKQALLTAYTINIDTHDFFDDVSGTEITGTGYTAGGATLGSKTATYDTATDQIRLDAADPSWTSSTLSATDSVTYKSTGTASTSQLLAGIDFGATVATTGGTFLVTFDSTGIWVTDIT